MNARHRQTDGKDWVMPVEARDPSEFAHTIETPSLLTGWERASEKRYQRAYDKVAKKRNAHIASGGLGVLDALVGHENRDEILSILEEPLAGDDVGYMPQNMDDQQLRDYQELRFHESSEPKEGFGSSTTQAVIENMKFRVRHLACWNMQDMDEEGQLPSKFNRLILDGGKFAKHVAKTTKERRYHGIRDDVFYPKTWKYRPIEADKRPANHEELSGLVAAFMQYQR